MRACVYGRVSSDEQALHGTSLQDQRDRLARFCEERGYEIIAAISDDFTGKLLTRPGLSEVSRLAEQRAFDVLVCLKIDRLARVNWLRRQYEEWLHLRGVQVLYLEQTFEPTPAGRLQRGIMGELAEYEGELIRERTTRGRIRKASESGRIPVYCRTYGYHQISVAEAQVIPAYSSRSGELLIVEEEAEIVRRLFTLCAGGMTLEQIAATLHREGVKTRLNGAWNPNSIRGMLRNETYAGRLYYNRSHSIRTGEVSETGWTRRRRTTRGEEDWIPIACPAIVSEELFQTVQARLDFNQQRMRGRRSAVWLLHGVVTCKHCKRDDGLPRACAGTVGWNNKDGPLYRYYRCTSRRRLDVPDCKTIYPADVLEGMALEALKRIARAGRLTRIAVSAAQRARRDAGSPLADVQRIQKTLAALETEESRLADLVLAGMSHTVIASKVSDIARRRRALTHELSQARSRSAVDSTEDAERRGKAAEEFLREKLDAATPADLALLFRLFLRVRIYRGEEPEIEVRVPSLQ